MSNKEKAILEEFKKLGYEISFSNKNLLFLIEVKKCNYIFIYRNEKHYSLSEFAKITMKEHKLLHELFELWGWLE